MLSVYFGAVVGRRDLGYGGSGQRPNETESSNRGALDVGPGHQTSQQLREATADPIPWHLALEGVGVRKKVGRRDRRR